MLGCETDIQTIEVWNDYYNQKTSRKIHAIAVFNRCDTQPLLLTHEDIRSDIGESNRGEQFKEIHQTKQEYVQKLIKKMHSVIQKNSRICNQSINLDETNRYPVGKICLEIKDL